MSTAPRSVAVVATRLPTTDRRALSQAWYSALHVAQGRPSAAAGSRGMHATASALKLAAAPKSTITQRAARPAGNAAPRSRTAVSTPPAVGAERRAPASDLARRIERALERRVPPAAVQRSTAVAIAAPEGRVQLLVRTDGETTRLIAVCAPHLRERVDRALAQVRFALAGSGTHVAAARV